MRVIISPAKKMRVDMDTFVCNDLLALLPKAEVLMEYIFATMVNIVLVLQRGMEPDIMEARIVYE